MRLNKLGIVFLILGVGLICLLVRVGNAQNSDPGEWKKIDLSGWSFIAPPDLHSEPFIGRDSAVWKFRSEDLKLTIDYGMYAGKPIEEHRDDNYVEKRAVIGGKKATLASYEFTSPNPKEFEYVSAVYFQRIDSGNLKLSFVALCRSPHEQTMAIKIFQSIKFK